MENAQAGGNLGIGYVVAVKLQGLKIAKARGKYYVYVRATGKKILNGFEGDKDALKKRLAMPDMIGIYNAQRKRDLQSFPDGTLGWLVAWFIDADQCPEFKALAESTREGYKESLKWLEPEYDTELNAISETSLYSVRDQCAKEKWNDFADRTMTALSTMFRAAVKRGKMANNPAKDIERLRKPNKNANREWRPNEWNAAWNAATLKQKIVMMLARHIGYRGQSIVKTQWSHYQSDDDYGMCFRFTHKKNDEIHWIPAPIELQTFLGSLTQTSTFIAVKNNGMPWRDEEQLQKSFSNFTASLVKRGLVEPGLTLHGLRVTFSAAIKRDALKRKEAIPSNAAVAAALGDRDERMGAHYTRHVENEIKVIEAFPKPNLPLGKDKGET